LVWFCVKNNSPLAALLLRGCCFGILEIDKINLKKPYCALLNRLYDRREGLRVVHSEVCQYLAVEADIFGAKRVDQLGVGRTVEACTCVDTSDPQAAECAFFSFAVAISEHHTPFEGVLGYRVDFATGAKIAACGFENFFPALT
jgi:hypothetical protein